MSKFAFSRELRLLTPTDFNFVFQKPIRVGTLRLILLSRLNKLGYSRIGIAIAKKHVNHAHERNRIKRIIRENFRQCQHRLPSMDFVVMAKKGIVDLDNCALSETLEKLWRRYYH